MNKIISVYFSGTGFSIEETGFLAASLYKETHESESQIKMGFNGCGVDYGLSGGIFGTGLDTQCDTVIERILQEITAGHHITLNAYGHSRGGVAALLLAKQLSHINPEKLAIHLALLDPVPGNFIATPSMDPLEISLANKTMDLSDCKPLKKVLALYPHVPLPIVACHTPLFATYPKDTHVDEEVVNGCHAQAEQIIQPHSRLVRLRVEEFLVRNGTQLQTTRDYENIEAMKQIYLDRYRLELNYVTQPLSRETHSARGVVITAHPDAIYFNERHKALAGDNSQKSVALGIQPERGLIVWFKKVFAPNTRADQMLKWALIGLAVTSLLYGTGDLSTLPLFSSIALKLGASIILAFSPVISGALAALWYGAVKPGLSWCAGNFFYPRYAIRHVATPNIKIQESTTRLMGALNADPSRVEQTVEQGLAPYHGRSPIYTAEKRIVDTDNSSQLGINAVRPH